MNSPTSPLDVWGVIRSTGVTGIEAIKITICPGGGFLVLTREAGQEYDVWVETLEEVEAELRELNVQWPPGT